MKKVSVIIPSYNHEAFIADSIASVLNQTTPVDEIIIIDDASTDHSLDRIRAIPDQRIRSIFLEKNHGGAETLNIGITAARNDVIAICNSDDVWEPEKIERQLAVLEANPDIVAVFCDVVWIGRHGEDIGGTPPFDGLFRERNRTRHDWLRRLFEQGNCLCHPSILIRKAVYDCVGPYDNRLRQLPDFHMWLRVLQHFDIYTLPEKLVRFRIHENTSTPSPATSARDRNEFADIALEFLQSIDQVNFLGAFGSKKAPFDPYFDLTMEKISYLWSSDRLQPALTSWLANALAMELLKTDSGQKIWASYDLSIRDFHILRGISSPWFPPRQLNNISAEEKTVLRKVTDGDRLGSLVLPKTGPKRAPWMGKTWLKLAAIVRHPANPHKRKAYRSLRA